VCQKKLSVKTGHPPEGSPKVSPRFRQGSTDAPPKYSKLRGVGGTLAELWWDLLENLLAVQNGSASHKRPGEMIPPRGFHHVPPKFHLGSAKVLQVTCCLRFSGAESSGGGSTKIHEDCATFVMSLFFWGRSLLFLKEFCGGPPPSLLCICLSVPSIFFAFFPYSVTFGVFSHSKGLGAK